MRLKIRRVADLEPIPNPMTLKKIISGGQIGTDIAALRAARKLGIKTGGSIPTGFKTLDGPKPGYFWYYRLNDDCPDYKSRTWKNVEQSDATLRLALDFGTPGEYCTLNAIRKYHKKHLDVYLETPWQQEPLEVARWITENGVQVLNVAGNAYAEIETKVELYLLEVFTVLRWY